MNKAELRNMLVKNFEDFLDKQLNQLSDDLSEVITKDDKPLTLTQLKESGLYYNEYDEGVYQYRTEGGRTLVQYGKILCENVKDSYWYEDDIYSFENEKGWTMMKGDRVLCEGVSYCYWLGDKYAYITHDDQMFTETI